MTVSVYTLLIRDEPDDTEGTQVRIVAASLTEAVARAELRFGASRILGIEQADASRAAVAGAVEESPAAPITADDFIVAPAPEPLPDLAAVESPATHAPTLREPDDARAASAALAYVHPLAGDDRIPPRAVEPDPVPGIAFQADPPPSDRSVFGKWRPGILLGAGAFAGLVAFLSWIYFGDSTRDRFITATAASSTDSPGLPLEGEAPEGGVIQAAGVTLRPGRADKDLGAITGETATRYPDEPIDDHEISYEPPGEIDDESVVALGTVVGEILSQWPDEEEPVAPTPESGSRPFWPRGGPPRSAPPEPAMLRRWYVEVQRADRITETLSVNATSAEQARAIVFNRPDHPVIVHGPSTDLTW